MVVEWEQTWEFGPTNKFSIAALGVEPLISLFLTTLYTVRAMNELLFSTADGVPLIDPRIAFP
jgi:hypothetical protein